MEQQAVLCKQVSRQFEQGETLVKALNGVDLTINKGEFVGLSGPSGSGKTTLLNMIGGLDRPSAGSVIVNGVPLETQKAGALADLRLNQLGFVFQAYNLIPVLSARENVEFVMQMQGVAAAERRRKALAILAEVGLQGMEDRRPDALSGGQQQRVAVARAIVSKPALVLADEPTANLDSQTASQLMQLFRQLNATHGTTFVISTHDELVMGYCKRLVRLRDGVVESDVLQDADG